MSIHDAVDQILISEDEIKERIKELGKELSGAYRGKNPLLICVLKGASVFMADLIRYMDIPLDIEFMDISSYHGGTESSGNVQIIKDLGQSAEDRHVLFVEDIIDTGRTMDFLIQLFESRASASIRIVSLLDKPSRRLMDIDIDWVGFEIPDTFIVGYGLDYQDQYRNLPYIAKLKEEKIQNN